ANAEAEAAPARRACVAQLYVDGVFRPGEISEEVQPAEVEAVEIYRTAAEVPPEFRREGSACGAILVWTRRGGEAR
ncbi:MAG TPA: hypothetical protein VF771_11280, partial [Longimicrobiaceae bacterium]